MAVVRSKNGSTIKSVTTVHADGRREVQAQPSASSLPPTAPRPIGLGDVVERYAKPLAHVIDHWSSRLLPEGWESHLAGCSACARRRTKLNLLCPNIETCPALQSLLALLPKPARQGLINALRSKL